MAGGIHADGDGRGEGCGKSMQDIRQKYVGNGDARADAQRRREIELSRAALKVAHKLHDARGLFIKRPARTREMDAAGNTVKQHASGFPFKPGDHM